ncbi:MAG: CHAT domain-containing tetratricopeptide repeat protein, partial [Bacteroidales bacterium]
ATIYNNIGSVYYDKGEYDKALEYYNKALEIRKEVFGEKHTDITASYIGIGLVYWNKKEFDKALEYYFKALQIKTEILGEKHPEIAQVYSNLGLVYADKREYDKALEYYLKALQLNTELLGEKHPDVAHNYDDIGIVYADKGEYDKAVEFYFRALQIVKEVLGEKNPRTAQLYIHIGDADFHEGNYLQALEYDQKAIASCIKNFNDTTDVQSTPVIREYSSWAYLLQALEDKAIFITDKYLMIRDLSFSERKKIALRSYQACDTLIDKTRKEISTQSDKLNLGEKASMLYKVTMELLTFDQPVAITKKEKEAAEVDRNLVFYFSEKNKSSVLLEALSGQEAQKYAGIPDSLLQKEHALQTDIALYTKKLAEPELLNRAQLALFQDKLFQRNRSYDSLIKVFENQFPEYHNLKYNNKTVTVKDIQKQLDNKSEMISYFTGDSIITIFSITANTFNVQNVPKMENLNDSIIWFRHGLTNTSTRMKENYCRLGYKLYQQLFPATFHPARGITNLYIIPDGSLSTIPFESLLTKEYNGDINAYKEYPYLIKDYSISYAYSASLFNLTFSKSNSSSPEMTKLNDWLAFAPVFDNSGDQNLSMSSRELQREISGLRTDSLMANRSMFNRSYIMPLPATETEAEGIFKLYDNDNLKAKVLLHDNANEHFLKSGELKQYKILHFATHGFVNSEKPELSGLLMAQDSTGGEDGILYSGEIYNLKMNADLVVLSACETGLGKIQTGEGIIGLTRAFLYAGAKNIIVSLWQVADESTSDLMVDFYKNILEGKNARSYSEALRNAKLKMISEGKYAHPLFWSPFILIGK